MNIDILYLHFCIFYDFSNQINIEEYSIIKGNIIKNISNYIKLVGCNLL
ncbi:hypothetical protein ICMP_145 [Candidatus Ishikawaella capsulata Mpkobe]|uniref:Uncharacterized protein n=1 Tax=Candidatus Ishikawaella capsulata Mpkobe TaxID=476281 RepID=C5WCF0_9ENTR|nr:hypothetical protein ICMP_145 [Candidatus Ishikawaella capsulata Mpkobe]